MKKEHYYRFTHTYMPGSYLAGDREISDEIDKLMDEWLEANGQYIQEYRIINITVTPINQAIFHQVHISYTLK